MLHLEPQLPAAADAQAKGLLHAVRFIKDGKSDGVIRVGYSQANFAGGYSINTLGCGDPQVAVGQFEDIPCIFKMLIPDAEQRMKLLPQFEQDSLVAAEPETGLARVDTCNPAKIESIARRRTL